MLIKNVLKFLAVFALIVFAACSSSNDDKTVWIYTSMFPEQIADFDKALKEKFPDIDVQWFQGGSENIAARIAMEMTSGDVKANLVQTGDFFWYSKMAEKGLWMPYKSSANQSQLPKAFSSPDSSFDTLRLTAMVIAYNKKFISPENAPTSFLDIVDSKFKSKISSGSPLESGTNFMLMNNLAYKYGYDFLQKMRENDVLTVGGNSNTLNRLISGERPIALMVLENALREAEKNPDIQVVFPKEGMVMVPAPLAITKNTKNVEDAKKIYDFLMSKEGQAIHVKQYVYSIDPQLPAPKGAISLDSAMQTSYDFSDGFLSFVKNEEESFKEKYSKIMFE